MHQVTVARQRRGEEAVSLFSDPWLKLMDGEGVPYYYNFRTDEISFTRPPDSRMRAAVRIQARARGISERARLERQGIKVVRLEPTKESVTKQRLMMQLTQLQVCHCASSAPRASVSLWVCVGGRVFAYLRTCVFRTGVRYQRILVMQLVGWVSWSC